MPFLGAAAPAIGAITGGVGAGASAASGKKGSNRANQIAQQQLQLQQQQFGLTKNLYNTGLNSAWTPAANYYNALLKGGQAAVQATGPYASLIGQAGQGARNSIQALTPRGGEQNLALAQNYNQTSDQIARLYAGQQPAAAQGLGQLAGTLFGAGAGVNPSANISAAEQAAIAQQEFAQQSGQGYGSLLYNLFNQWSQNRSGGGDSSGSSNWGGWFPG